MNPQQTKIPIQILHNGLTCPHCGSHRVIKNGSRKNNHQYQCKHCGKAHCTTTGTAMHGIHKRDLFEKYTKCLLDGMTIRQAAKWLGISVTTSFKWRHRHLSAQSVSPENIEHSLVVAGIEHDDYSEKGVRSRNSNLKNAPKVKTIVVTDESRRVIIRKVDSTKAVSSDINKLIPFTTQVIPERHKSFTAGAKHTQHVYHIQKSKERMHFLKLLSETKKELRNWMAKFNGVATKYLQHYWNWFSVMKNYFSPQDQILINSLCNRGTMAEFRNVCRN